MKNEKINKYPKIDSTILMVAAALLLFAIVSLYIHYNKTDSGPIGDAFNGITAPFIALLSALLLYHSFKAQIKANRMQYEANIMLESQWKFDTYLSLFREIENEFHQLAISFNNIPLHPNPKFESIFGKLAFDAIAHYGIGTGAIQGGVKAFEELGEITEEFIYLIKEIEKSEFSQKHYISYKIIRFYNINFRGLTPEMQKAFLSHNTKKTEATFVSLANLAFEIRKMEKIFNS